MTQRIVLRSDGGNRHMTDVVKWFKTFVHGKQEMPRAAVTISDKGVVSVDPTSLLQAAVAQKQLDAAKRIEQQRNDANRH